MLASVVLESDRDEGDGVSGHWGLARPVRVGVPRLSCIAGAVRDLALTHDDPPNVNELGCMVSELLATLTHVKQRFANRRVAWA